MPFFVPQYERHFRESRFLSPCSKRFAGHGQLPRRSNCKGPLGLPCAVTPFGTWPRVTLFSRAARLSRPATRNYQTVKRGHLARYEILAFPTVASILLSRNCR